MHVIAFVLLGLSLYVSLSRAFEEQGVATLHKNRDAGFEAEQGQPAKLHREQKEQLMQLSQYDWQRSDSANGRTLRSEAERAVAASDVAVVNDIPAHFEVLASVLVVLNQLGVYPEVYYTGELQESGCRPGHERRLSVMTADTMFGIRMLSTQAGLASARHSISVDAVQSDTS